jgi:SAM-dependent methyltransferase
MPQEVADGRFGVELFEQLDAEYGSRPVRKAPVPRDEQSIQDKARHRIETISRQLGTGFDDKVVLELGCGHGWLTAYLPEIGGAVEAIGVDPFRYDTWARHTDPRVRLIEVDLASDRVLDDASVDLVISGAVFEHVTRPVEMLAALWDVLKPGGRAWLYFNLYRGPQASHRYNEVRFPWPHLLFDDDVCSAYYERNHDRRAVQFAWVNKMTVANYVQVTHELGFRIVSLKRRVVPIDVPFYLRFADVLGRYPALDLETDFATLILEKPAPGPALAARPPREMPPLGYLERERALREAIAAHGRSRA